MNRRELLGRIAALPFVGALGSAIAARPQTFEPAKTTVEWATRQGWRVILYDPPAFDAASEWLAWVETRSGVHVGWIDTAGRFLPKP